MRKVVFIGLIFFAACKQKCSDNAARDLMGSWYKKKLVPGQGWRLINAQYITPEDSFALDKANSAYYILHYFVADCDKCINDLLEAKTFIEKNHRNYPDLKYVFVASGASDVYICDAIKKSGFEFPVYYEQKYLAFKKANDFPLKDDLNNTMLVNRSGELLLFGSFYDNEQTQSNFSDIVNCK